MSRLQAIQARYIISQPTMEIKENQTLLIEDNLITEIGYNLDTSGYELTYLPHHVIIPGLVNTHTHAAMTLFRNFADDVPLQEWLNDHIWPMEAKLTANQVFVAAKLAAVEGIFGGITTMNSMYWHPDQEARAFTEIGTRLMTGPPIISGVTSTELYDPLLNNYHNTRDDLTRVAINPHAPYTVTADEFQQVKKYKDNYNANHVGPDLMVHTHLAETSSEMEAIRGYANQQGFDIDSEIRTPIQYLDSLGVLEPGLIAAHSIELTDSDIRTVIERQVGIAANHVSNLKLGNGIVRLHELCQDNAKIGLGTDGPASNNSIDMFETMKYSALTQKGRLSDPTTMDAKSVLRMATVGGAEVLNWDEIGVLSPGKYADLVAIDLNKPHLHPIRNPASLMSALIYSVKSSDVSDVMVHGKWKLKARTLVDMDLNIIIDEFNQQVAQLFSDTH